MASLSRRFLSALGIEQEKQDEILNTHQEVLAEIKDERDKYKEEAAKLPEVQKELDEAKASLEKNAGSNDFEEKFNTLKAEYDKFKADITAEKEKTAKENAYRALLKEAGISEKRYDTILKVTDLSKVALDKDGKIENAEAVGESIKTEWADFIETKSEEGASAATPPSLGETKTGNGGRAAELEAMYHKERYGVSKEDK